MEMRLVGVDPKPTTRKIILDTNTVKHPVKNVVVLEFVPIKESIQITTGETVQENVANLEESISQEKQKLLYGCDTCNSFYDSKSVLNDHRKEAHSLEAPCLKESTRPLSIRQPKCNICLSFYMTKSELMNHLKTAHDLNSSSSDSSNLREHKCKICKEVFALKNVLTKHLEDVHYIHLKKTEKERHGELQSNGRKVHSYHMDAFEERVKDAHEKDAKSTDTEIVERARKKVFQCSICKLSYASKHGFLRHSRTAHNKGGTDSGICHHCGNMYRITHLPAHEKTCVKKSKHRRRQDCSFKDCGLSYYKKENLIEHLKSVHGMRIEPMRTLKFKSEEEFRAWKEEEEERTFSYFSKHAGTKNNKRSYYCQHEGTEKSHRSSTDTTQKKKENKKGRIKKGGVCTAYLRTATTDTEVVVYYWPTHNHPLSPDDVKHQPLSKETIAFIKEQIALNVPSRQIQVMLKKRFSESCNRRDAKVISLKRITSLAQRYHRQAAAEGNIPNAMVQTFNSFMDVLATQEDSPVLFYQPPSANANLEVPNKEDDLFFIALQTVDQQKMLQRDFSMPMFISYTQADYTFQYYLISILVPCEKNFEYPVGHLMTSQLNEEVISLFLQTVGERCPELNVNCIVSIDCPEINNAIRKVFGNDGPYFLSKWHFLEYMRNHFLKPVPSNKVEELFDFILAMADAETEDRFLLLYNTFKEQFESEFPDIVSSFADYFVRASMWASCYRQGPGIIDSCLYADSFFNKLNKKYRRRPTKSINVVTDLLLFMQEEYKDNREAKVLNSDCEAGKMKEQHSIALDILPDLVQETLSHHWTVQGSKHGQSYLVMHCVSKCSERDCQLRCSECVNLCSHNYFCNCGQSGLICQHVHKVHQQYGSLLETEDDCEEAGDMIMDQEEDPEVSCYNVEEFEEQAAPSTIAETMRAECLGYLDNIKTAVGNMPLEMLHVCHETLSSLCDLTSGNAANDA